MSGDGTASTTAVLVNYNGHRDTIECVESLLRLTAPGARIVIVDNYSTSASRERIKEWAAAQALASDVSSTVWNTVLKSPRRAADFAVMSAAEAKHSTPSAWITLICSDDNLGYAGATNLGAAFALRDPNCHYIWVLNNDTVVEADALSALQRRFSVTPQLGMCGSTLLYYDTPGMVQGLGGRFNLILGRGRPIGSGLPAGDLPSLDTVESQMNHVIGASILTPRTFWEAVGPMEESYFLYFEELDWATRAKGVARMGWAPDSIVYHKEGATIGSSVRHRPSNTSLYYLAVNLLRFNAKFHPLLLPLSVAKLVLLYLRYLFKRDAPAARLMLVALRDFTTRRYMRGPIGP